ncbi:sulfatase [Rubritalea tangerina]|uniref:Sulfatase n=1 Tax=Rubritalea tangerina TaxID=430798 RepID=A0ABW4Z8Q9_9BACT
MLSVCAVEARDKPNIIFILADDLGYQDVGFNGSRWFETPHLDALAKESVVFDNASMYPTCSPSRAALFTGRHSFRTQVYTVPVLEKGKAADNLYSRWTVEEKHPFYSQPLRSVGYQLIHLGKWHVVGPYPERELDYPFKKKLGTPGSGDMSWVERHKREYVERFYPEGRGFHKNVGGTFWGDPARGYKAGYKSESGGYKAPFKNPFMQEGEEGDWLTDALTDEAIRFMKENKKKPFFINLHYYSPHRPSVATSSDALEKYQKKVLDVGTGQSAQVTKEMAAYGTMVENLDMNIGRILDALDVLGVRENTIIVFTSDNGYNGIQSFTQCLRGSKGQIYEGGLRVPALVHWSGRYKGARVDENITVLDYFPTLLEWAGVEDYKSMLDGESIVPLLEGGSLGERALFWHIASNYKTPANTVMKKGAWKLIQFLKTGEVELYHLVDDPLEERNLAKSHADRAKLMLDEMESWREKHSVPLPESSISNPKKDDE